MMGGTEIAVFAVVIMVALFFKFGFDSWLY